MALIELELNVEDAIDSHLILDILLIFGFRLRGVENEELLFPSDPVVVSIDSDEDKILDLHDDAVVGLELLLHPVEAEVVVRALVQHSRRFQVPHQAQELRVLVFVELVLDQPHQLHSDTLVLHLGARFYLDCHFSFHVLAVGKYWCFHLVSLAVSN